MSEPLISIGKILGPQGIKGEVRVLPLTDFPSRFATTKEVRIDKKNVVMKVDYAREHGTLFIFKFHGIDTRDEAEKLKHALLQVTREDLVKLPEGEYYHFEIIGLRVVSSAGEELGTITNILQTGANDVYVVKKPEGKKDLLIPALKTIVQEIDLGKNTMRVDLPPGLDK